MNMDDCMHDDAHSNGAVRNLHTRGKKSLNSGALSIL